MPTERRQNRHCEHGQARRRGNDETEQEEHDHHHEDEQRARHTGNCVGSPVQKRVRNQAVLHNQVNTTCETDDERNANQARSAINECLGNGLLVKAAQEHADDGDSEERSGHLREPPALSHNAPNHDNECHDEEHQNDLALPVERRNVVRIGVMRSIELGELLTVFIGVAELGVRLDLLAVPIQVGDNDDSANDAADNAPHDAFGPDNAGSIRSDNDRERVDRRERGAHGACEEDSANADDGVIAQCQEDRHQNRIERNSLFFETAGGAAQNHERGHEEYERELATLRLLRERDQATLECAGCVHNADQATKNQNEDHDVNAVDSAIDHRGEDVGNTHGLRLELGVGTGNRNCLGDSAVQELIDIDLHAGEFGVGMECLSRAFNSTNVAIGLGDLEHARVGDVGDLGIGARGNKPRRDNCENGDYEQDRKCRREAELMLLLRLSVSRAVSHRRGHCLFCHSSSL